MSRDRAKYTIIAMDYFAKWAEAKLFTSTTSKKVTNFVVKNSVDMEFHIISLLVTLWVRYRIGNSFLVVAHPQGNRQVELMNKIIKSVIRTSTSVRK